MSESLVHATSIAIGGHAVLLLGASGAGKSDLALRLIDRGADLVSDDYTVLTRAGDALIASAPARIAGQIEVRGVGIVAYPHRQSAPVALLARLGGPVERLPEPRHETIAGVAFPVLALDPHEASAPIKLELALKRTIEAI